MKKTFGVAILVALCGLALAPAASAEVVVKQWEIPFINSVTGPTAGYGKLCDFFVAYAAKEINDHGGIAGKPVVIQNCDDAMDPTRSASCMKKAVDQSLVVIGPMTSLSAQVGAPIAAQQKVMTIPAAAGYETIKDSRPWAVVIQTPNERRAEFTMNAWLDQNGGKIKKVVMLGFPNIAQWKALGELQKAALEKRGVQVVDNIDVQSGAVDVSSVVVRALKSQPDGIVTRLMPADTIRVVGEIVKRGFKNKSAIYSHATVDTPELYSMSQQAGNLMDGTYLGMWGRGQDTPEYHALLDAFRKLPGQAEAKGLMWGNQFYVALYMAKDAIEKTGATGDPAKRGEERRKIQEHINAFKDFDTRVLGKISALPNGTFTTPVYLGLVQGGDAKIVASSDTYQFKQ